MTGDQSSDVLLAFDFGYRRIGIASGNLRTRTASPLTTLTVRGELPWAELDRTIDEWCPHQLVVGLPDSDVENKVAARAEQFMAELRDRYGLPVAPVDESFTSRTAQSELKEARQSGALRTRVRKGQIDSHAACLIAEQWMNE
ncbi:MAG: Holliday junction resolvase RuvX [Candidatus Rariloculaceae bacterium]